MSRYLYNAAYYWEVVVDKRSPEGGLPVFLEERSTGKRRFLKNLTSPKELESFCRTVQKDLYLSEEEFEEKYGVQLSAPSSSSPSEAPPQNDLPQVV
ncbi:MAG: hypothetical protein KY468_08955 [Armatimonadetes bacterium]|nr:hypothetical protein [Armatimonadota bacterium]